MGSKSWENANRRVFGWAVYLEHPDPKEAPLIRQAAADVIAGASPFDIARRWTADRVPTVYSRPAWNGVVVTRILQRKTNTAGPRPLLSHTVYEAVLAALATPRPRRAPRTPERAGIGKYVCTAVVVCGTCGALTGMGGQMDGERKRLACYRRRHTGRRDGERHPTMPLAVVEDLIVAATLTATNMSADQFAALTVRQRREVANTVVSAKIIPTGSRSMGQLVIEARS